MQEEDDYCCCEEEEEESTTSALETVYKEVVIVGNGPSGIITSYMLAGNWPYYTGTGHSVDFLHYRLAENEHSSLVQQDLVQLCDGLEGRSSNPVSVLFDHLNHPDADLGLSLPSLLDWRHRADQVVDHVVLGSSEPGGSWQSMEGSTLTISLGSWMELPEMTFKEWQLQRDNSSGLKVNRVVVRRVAQYYSDYVHERGLDQYFRNRSQVVSVRRLAEREEAGRDLWEVQGFQAAAGGEDGAEPFRYVTPHVVLATGSYDCPNVLGVPGEDLPFVIHSLSALESLIKRRHIGHASDPIMVVGAGLSAADAIITAHFFGVPVVHVFRRGVNDPNLIFKKLPENMYPEYHKVHQMMQGKGVGYHGYHPRPHTHVVGVGANRKVRLQGANASAVVQVSYVVVMVGSSPDLSYLPRSGQHLSVEPHRPINCRDNPINVDVFTHESVVEPGLFATGPLVGDNFVRFVQGGALAIASHLYKKKRREQVEA